MASPHQDPQSVVLASSAPHEFHFFSVLGYCFHFYGLWLRSAYALYVESSIAAWQTFRVLSIFLSFTKFTLNESRMAFGDCISTQFVLTSRYLFCQLSDWHIVSFVPSVLYKLINLFLNCSKITDENYYKLVIFIVIFYLHIQCSPNYKVLLLLMNVPWIDVLATSFFFFPTWQGVLEAMVYMVYIRLRKALFVSIFFLDSTLCSWFNHWLTS